MSRIGEFIRNRLKPGSLPGEVVALYLYGSALTGNFREDSDIDVAFLPDFKTDPMRRLELISIIEAEVTNILRELGYDLPVSVLDLRGRTVSYLLQYTVITEGELLYETDHEQRIEYENAATSMYFDFERSSNRIASSRT